MRLLLRGGGGAGLTILVAAILLICHADGANYARFDGGGEGLAAGTSSEAVADRNGHHGSHELKHKEAQLMLELQQKNKRAANHEIKKEDSLLHALKKKAEENHSKHSNHEVNKEKKLMHELEKKAHENKAKHASHEANKEKKLMHELKKAEKKVGHGTHEKKKEHGHGPKHGYWVNERAMYHHLKLLFRDVGRTGKKSAGVATKLGQLMPHLVGVEEKGKKIREEVAKVLKEEDVGGHMAKKIEGQVVQFIKESKGHWRRHSKWAQVEKGQFEKIEANMLNLLKESLVELGKTGAHSGEIAKELGRTIIRNRWLAKKRITHAFEELLAKKHKVAKAQSGALSKHLTQLIMLIRKHGHYGHPHHHHGHPHHHHGHPHHHHGPAHHHHHGHPHWHGYGRHKYWINGRQFAIHMGRFLEELGKEGAKSTKVAKQLADAIKSFEGFGHTWKEAKQKIAGVLKAEGVSGRLERFIIHHLLHVLMESGGHWHARNAWYEHHKKMFEKNKKEIISHFREALIALSKTASAKAGSVFSGLGQIVVWEEFDTKKALKTKISELLHREGVPATEANLVVKHLTDLFNVVRKHGSVRRHYHYAHPNFHYYYHYGHPHHGHKHHGHGHHGHGHHHGHHHHHGHQHHGHHHPHHHPHLGHPHYWINRKLVLWHLGRIFEALGRQGASNAGKVANDLGRALASLASLESTRRDDREEIAKVLKADSVTGHEERVIRDNLVHILMEARGHWSRRNKWEAKHENQFVRVEKEVLNRLSGVFMGLAKTGSKDSDVCKGLGKILLAESQGMSGGWLWERTSELLGKLNASGKEVEAVVKGLAHFLDVIRRHERGWGWKRYRGCGVNGRVVSNDVSHLLTAVGKAGDKAAEVATELGKLIRSSEHEEEEKVIEDAKAILKTDGLTAVEEKHVLRFLENFLAVARRP